MTPTEQAKRVADAIERAKQEHGHEFGIYTFEGCNESSLCVLANELLRLNSDYTRWWPNPTTQQIIEHQRAGGTVEVAGYAGHWEKATRRSCPDHGDKGWSYYRLVLAPPPPATEWVPLHEVIGRTIPTPPERNWHTFPLVPVKEIRYQHEFETWSWWGGYGWQAFTVADGKVEVLTEGAES